MITERGGLQKKTPPRRMGLEAVEIVMKVEEHFGVSVPDEVASNFITVADLQREVEDLLVRKGGRARLT